MHVEAECPFITFDDLLDRIEDLVLLTPSLPHTITPSHPHSPQVCSVIARLLKSPIACLFKEMNPVSQYVVILKMWRHSVAIFSCRALSPPSVRSGEEGLLLFLIHSHFSLRRMNYSDAITYLRENDIKKDDGSYYEFGEDILEVHERRMTDQINEVWVLYLSYNVSPPPFSRSCCAGFQLRSSPSTCHAAPKTSV